MIMQKIYTIFRQNTAHPRDRIFVDVNTDDSYTRNKNTANGIVR